MEENIIPQISTHAAKCVLAEYCTLAGGNTCAPICPSYLALHGYNGAGGRIAAAGVPPAYRRVTLSNSPAAADQAQAYAAVRQYVATFSRQFDPDGEPIKSLYLVSPSPGTGKTTTAVAVLNAYIVAHYIGSLQRNRQALERPAYFLDANEWQALYNEFNRPKVPDEIAEPAAADYYRRSRRAIETPFCVIDDIGVRKDTDGFRGDLHAVINARVAAGLPTVYTSNVPITELSAIFDARLADRVRDQCREVEFTGGSKRGFRKTEVQR